MPSEEELNAYISQIENLKTQNASYADQVNFLRNKGISNQKIIDAVIASIEAESD